MAYSWNQDWTAVHGVEFAALTRDSAIYTLFRTAFNERLKSMGFTRPTGDVSGIAAGVASLPNWQDLQALVNGFALNYTKTYADDGVTPISATVADGGSVDPARWIAFSYTTQTYDFAASTTPVVVANSSSLFPPPNGWQRQFPREIWTLSNPGSAGQRARFVALTGASQWFGADANPASPTSPSTPVGERANAGKYFTYTSGAWVLSGDQSSQPDVVQVKGLACRGDYITGLWLNQLRDAINFLTRWHFTTTGLFYGSLSTTPVHHYLYGTFLGLAGPSQFLAFAGTSTQAFYITWTGKGSANTKTAAVAYAGGTDAAQYSTVQTRYGSASASVQEDTLPNALDQTPFGSTYTLTSLFGYLKVNVPSDAYNKTIYTYKQCAATGGDLISTVVTAFGLSPDGLWHLANTDASQSGAIYYTSIVGDAALTRPDRASATNGSHGLPAYTVLMMLDFEVSGGFAYTRNTP